MDPIKCYERNNPETLVWLWGLIWDYEREFLTFLHAEVLESSTLPVPGDQVELDEPRRDLGVGGEGEGEDGERVLLVPAVLQLLVDHGAPGPGRVVTDGHLELLAAPVPVVPVVGVDQLHHVDDLVAAEVQDELRSGLLRSQPVVLLVELHPTVGEELGGGEGVLLAAGPGPVLLRHHTHGLVVRTLWREKQRFVFRFFSIVCQSVKWGLKEVFLQRK